MSEQDLTGSDSTEDAQAGEQTALAERLERLEARLADLSAQVDSGFETGLRATRGAAERARGISWLVPQEINALQFLERDLSHERLLPPLGGWAMDYSVVAVIHDFLRSLGRPAVVVELGSGVGTPWLALSVATTGGRLLSVEHDEAFVSSTSRLVAHYGLEDTSTLVHAPLEERSDEDPWYSLDALGEELDAFLGSDQIDLLLVDGPPGTTGPHARRPALPELHGRLGTGALVILDDTIREHERAIWQGWLEEFADQLETYPLRLTNASMALWRGRDA